MQPETDKIYAIIDPVIRAGGGNHSRVVDGLGRAIVAGKPAPGDLLPGDEELIETYGVSRTVLREAMKTLAAKGMILAKARVGTRVRPRRDWNMFDAQLLHWHVHGAPPDDFLRQLFEMRLAFEPFAAQLAAAKATADDIERMNSQVEQMRDAVDQTVFSLADMEFHKAVFDAAGNAFFHSVVSLVGVALQSLLLRSSPERQPEQFTAICDRHQDIADAIRDGDQETAKAAMTGVIEFGWKRIFGETQVLTPKR